ncbi:MAG TPA: hypothetical protein ENI07_15595 [Desulfobacterales bacterium]|nr:hypothetical protein [Desulfobacterales bacterium]
MKDNREIYSIQDCINILEEVLKEQLGLGDYVREAVCDEVERKFEYVNWDRFQSANCPGCVSGPDDCDIAYGKGEWGGAWQKIVDGNMQSCARRVNGTMQFNTAEQEKGIHPIDIADHEFNVVPPLKEE